MIPSFNEIENVIFGCPQQSRYFSFTYREVTSALFLLRREVHPGEYHYGILVTKVVRYALCPRWAFSVHCRGKVQVRVRQKEEVF